ncbi:MAG: sporulation protein YabP [Bacillota bacterium]|nr:sporulation protein YabP [Bacillota bacterium]
MEVKKEVKLEEKKSNLTLENRRKLFLTGVMEVISFNEEKILLNTSLGMLTIKGSGLKMNKLDVQNGEVMMVGNVESFVYSGSEAKQDKESILSKLFK